MEMMEIKKVEMGHKHGLCTCQVYQIDVGASTDSWVGRIVRIYTAARIKWTMITETTGHEEVAKEEQRAVCACGFHDFREVIESACGMRFLKCAIGTEGYRFC